MWIDRHELHHEPTNLNRLNMIVYWMDRFGGLHNFQLQPDCAASVKIMFRRKDFRVARNIFISRDNIMSETFEQVLVEGDLLGCIIS